MFADAKIEWPLILPDDEDVRQLSQATRDISEYVVDISKNEGLAAGMSALDGSVTVHLACHSRAQNMGQKAAELIRLIPDADVQVIERCSGHGGSWGMMKDNFETGIKVGRPAARKALETAPRYVVSEVRWPAFIFCRNGTAYIEKQDAPLKAPEHAPHPVQLLAKSYRAGKE